MIVAHDTKATQSPKGLAQLLLGNDVKEGGDGFAKLLADLKTPQDNEKIGILLPKKELSKSTQSDDAKLMSLLKGDETPQLMKEDIALLDPQLTKTLTQKDLVQLVHNAKAFLKEQITKTSDIKETPTTLKGLLSLAKKVGIDLTQIKIESVVLKQDQALQTTNEKQEASPTSIKTTLAPKEAKTVPKPTVSTSKTTLPTQKVSASTLPSTPLTQPLEHSTAQIVQAKKGIEVQPRETQKDKSNPLRSLLQISNNEGERSPLPLMPLHQLQVFQNKHFLTKH